MIFIADIIHRFWGMIFDDGKDKIGRKSQVCQLALRE